MAKSKSRSRFGNKGKGGKKKAAAKKRKNPKRAAAAKKAWAKRRRGEPKKRKNPKRAAAAKKAWEKRRRGEAKKGSKPKKAKKRRGQPYAGSALQRYNAARASKKTAAGLSREEILRRRAERKLSKKRARLGDGAFTIRGGGPAALPASATTPYLQQLRDKMLRQRAEREATDMARFA